MTMPAGGFQLPNAGTGGPTRSTHLPFLIALGVASAAVGGVCALFGWRKAVEQENDGVTSLLVPIHWVEGEASRRTPASLYS